MEKQARCVIAASLLAGLATALPGQTRRAWGPTQVAEVRRFAEGLLDRFAIPGLSIGLVLDREDVFAEGYGVSSIETQEPLDRFSLFHLASVSKTFVATAVFQLVERGQLELDAPVQQIIPDFALDDPRAAGITVRQLLAHTSGMPDTGDYGWDRPKHDDDALAKYVAGLRELNLQSDPGQAWSYSNIAYEVLGHVIAATTEQTFEDAIRERILLPIDMHHSDFLKPRLPQDKLSSPHIGPGQPIVSSVYPYNREHAPSSTLHSNAIDMTRYIRAWLSQGRLSDAVLLTPASVATMWSLQFDRGAGRDGMAHGWFIAQSRLGKLVTHSGADVGFRSHLMIAPDRNVGVAIMSNHERAPVRTIARDLLYYAAGERELSLANYRRPLSLSLEAKRLESGIDSAMAEYARLQRDAPEEHDYEPDQLIDYAWELIALGVPNDAVVTMQHLVADMPDHHLPHRFLAHMLLEAGRIEEAKEAVNRSLAIRPTHEPAVRLAKEIARALHDRRR